VIIHMNDLWGRGETITSAHPRTEWPGSKRGDR
jgi:hypothetical protein